MYFMCALYIVIVTDDEIQTEFCRLAAGEGKVQFQVVSNSYLHSSFELLGLVKNSNLTKYTEVQWRKEM